MKKVYLLVLTSLLSVAAFAQSTISIIYATGITGSYKTGNATATARNSGNVRSSGSGTIRKGYGVFDLTTIPAGTIIDSCVVGFNVATYGGSGTPSGWVTYGYPGDLSTVTTAATLFSDPSSGAQINK